MTKNLIAAVVGSVCAMFLWEPHSFAQSLSGTSLSISGPATVTGTATISALTSGSAAITVLTSSTAIFNALDVTGVPDFQNNTLFFGTSGTNPALSIVYDDGGNSSITLQSTRPSSVWNWQRTMASGSAATAMQLDASNRLILTGTVATNPPQLVLDPNGSVSLNGSNLLTQTAANALYLSATAGLVESNGNVGIGTASPSSSLNVAGVTTLQSGDATSGALKIGADVQATTLTANVRKLGRITTPSYNNAYNFAVLSADSPNAATDFVGFGGAPGASAPAPTYLSFTTTGTAGNAAGNTERMRITGNGNVGIGTTNPSGSLHIVGSASQNFLGLFAENGIAPENSIVAPTSGHMVSVQGNGGAYFMGRDVTNDIEFIMGTSITGAAFAGSMTNHAFQLRTNNTTRTTIDTSGNLTQTGNIIIQGTGNSSFAGNVGVGTSSPSYKIETVGGSSGAETILAQLRSNATDNNTSTVLKLSNSTASPAMAGAVELAAIRTNLPNSGAADFVIRTSSDIYTIVEKLRIAANGNIGIGTATPQAKLDVNGSAKIAGNLAISSTGSLTLADGSVLSGSNTLKSVMASGTALTISGSVSASQVAGLSTVATTGNYNSLTGLPSIPTDTNQLANGAGYITASGTAAFAQASATTAALSGTIQASQVEGIAPVATGGTLDYSKLTNAPTSVLASSGTANNLALSGTTNITGTANINGDTTVYGKFTVSGSNGSTASTPSGISITYADGTNGVGSSITIQSTNPSSVWNWQRAAASGTSATAMQLDASNRLILTGTDATNPPQIVLDPNGTISMNGSNLLTKTAADLLYIPTTSGLVAANGNIGIGTTSPGYPLEVNGAISFVDTTNGGGSFNWVHNGNVSYEPYNFLELYSTGGDTPNDPITTIGPNGEILSTGAQAFVGVADRSDYLNRSADGGLYRMFGVIHVWNTHKCTDAVSIADNGDVAFGVTGYSSYWSDGDSSTIPAPFYVANVASFASSVGVGTTNPQATLDVQGNARFSGPIRVEPQGDLDMGGFTSEPAPPDQQSTQSFASKQTSRVANGSVSAITSGTARTFSRPFPGNQSVSGSNNALTTGTAFTH